MAAESLLIGAKGANAGLPTTAPGVVTTSNTLTGAAAATVRGTGTGTNGLLSSAGSTSTTQPLIVGDPTTALNSTARCTAFPQTANGFVVSNSPISYSTSPGAEAASSTAASGSGTPTEPTVIFITKSGQSQSQLSTSRSTTPPYGMADSMTKPTATSRLQPQFPGNTTRLSLSPTNQYEAPETVVSSPSTQMTATTALTSRILTSTVPTSTISSTPSPSSAGAPSFKPTGTPNTNVPTANTNFPTATTSVEPATYSQNVAQARHLNQIYASLTPQSACSGTQLACIQGKVGQCNNGAFALTGCPATKTCYALPMTNTRGAKIACIDRAGAIKILGPAAGDTTSASSAPTDTLPTTFRTERTRPVSTHTRIVLITDTSLPSAPGPSTMQSQGQATTLGPMSSELPFRTKMTTTTSTILPSSSSTSSTSPTPTPSSSSSSSSSTTTTTRPSPPPPPPPSPSPPTTTTTPRPSFIIITQTFDTPTPPPQAQTPTPTTTTTPPGILELIPVDLSTLLSPPSPARITPLPIAKPPNSFALAPPAGPPPLPSAPQQSDIPRTTVTCNGTPTVSVYVTLTVTQKEQVTQVLTVTETVTVTATA
ncbi:hypothetical protein E4U55_000803 [Claviceps digitariae]|nr:hypothetical protein E4U55_000803 [Claviceps digitariae]